MNREITNSTYKIGDKVRIKKGLQLGAVYYNDRTGVGDTYTNAMRNNVGFDTEIVSIRGNGGYELEIDSVGTYYDEMIEYVVDDLAVSEYSFNPEVEGLINHMLKIQKKQLVDKALDDKLFLTDPEAFKRLVDDIN